MVIRERRTSNNTSRAERVGNTIRSGKLIETADSIGHHVDNHEARKPLIGKAVDARAQAFFDGPNRTFHVTHMAVGGDDVHLDRPQAVAHAFELTVTMHVANNEPTRSVEVENRLEFAPDGGSASIGDGGNGPETNVAGYRVEKGVPLNKKNVDA